jgi:hypothetical protein
VLGSGDSEMDDHTVVGGAGTIVDGVASAAGPLSLAALTRRTGISFATVNNRDLTMTARACGRSHARGRTLLTRHIDVRGIGRALRKFAESLAAELMPPPATGASQDHGIERPPGAHRHVGRD